MEIFNTLTQQLNTYKDLLNCPS